jgi:hypothetical protein
LWFRQPGTQGAKTVGNFGRDFLASASPLQQLSVSDIGTRKVPYSYVSLFGEADDSDAETLDAPMATS